MRFLNIAWGMVGQSVCLFFFFLVDVWEPKLENNSVEYCFVMVEN